MRLKNMPNKKADAEARVGMPLTSYMKDAMNSGKTQREMAAELGVSYQTVGNWLRAEGYRYGGRYYRVRN